MKAEAEPIRAISHIQKTAPAPPIAIAEATPAKLPVPTLDAVPIQNAWNEETCPLLFYFELVPSPSNLNISLKLVN